MGGVDASGKARGSRAGAALAEVSRSGESDAITLNDGMDPARFLVYRLVMGQGCAMSHPIKARRAGDGSYYIAIDLAKNVFALCGADADGQIVLRKELRRAQLSSFMRKLGPGVIGMEASGGRTTGLARWQRWGMRFGSSVRRW